jgi:hypothetical protein
MKKFALIISIVCIIVSCNKTKSLLKESTEPILSPVKEINTENVIESNENIEFVVYEHIQTLFFEYSGYDVKVLKEPLKNEILYTVQKGDNIEITKVIDYESVEKTFIQVKTPLGENGFIRIGSNPYGNGEYSSLGTINVGGVDITVLKMTQSFNINEGTFMKSLPSSDSENVYEITHKQGSGLYNSIAITSDYKWVKISINEHEGWVPDNCLSVARGGPIINHPKASIYFDLIGGNEI